MRARLKICVVSNRTHSPHFSASLAMMMTQCALLPHVFESVGLCMLPWQSYLPAAREQAIRTAKENGSTHALFIDDDSVFPSTSAAQLLGHLYRLHNLSDTGELAIIGANFARKQMPLSWTAEDLNGQELSSIGKVGCEAVSRIGFGLTLIPLEVFDKIRSPWFMWRHSDDDVFHGEDSVFCERMRHAKVDIWVDHDLSLQCKHAGEHLYGYREPAVEVLARLQKEINT